MTASAFPLLSEGPIVPAEVQIPTGVFSAAILIPILLVKGDLSPA